MNKIYAIRNHGKRMQPMWSVDQVDDTGKYICQEAFWFKPKGNGGADLRTCKAEAYKTAERMIEEDVQKGIKSQLFD